MDKFAVVSDILGAPGRMLGSSKSRYSDRYPDHLVFFNGNVYESNADKLWWGDIDLHADWDKLTKLVDTLGEPIFVAFETPYRFQTPTLEQLEAVAARPLFPSVIKIGLKSHSCSKCRKLPGKSEIIYSRSKWICDNCSSF